MKEWMGTVLAALKTAVKIQILARSVRAGQAVSGPVVVAGMFRTASGLGNSAWSCLLGLRDSGIDAVGVDLSEAFNQVDLAPDPRLVPMPLQPTGTLILHANWPETVPALMQLGMRRWHRWRIIGYWAWELCEEPIGAHEAAKYLSEVWTCSRFCVDAFSGVSLPVHCVPHRIISPPLDVPSVSQKTCLIMADGRSSFDRKNVLAAVRIFERALGQDQDWKLVVKCRNLDQDQRATSELKQHINALERAELMTESIPIEDVHRLVAGCDIMLSAHRSEGFGMPLAEAMARGKCVVATGWSGNLEFMTPVNSVLLPYSLCKVVDGSGVYSGYPNAEWAEVDVVASARLLAEVAHDTQKRQQIGARAAADIAGKLDGSIYAETLRINARESDR